MAVRELPKPEIVIVAVVAVAVNLYQLPYVVREVAPAQAPVGAALAAFFKFPEVAEHVVPGVSVAAAAQVA